MASSDGTKRKAITHDRGQAGLTLHYMTKEELWGCVQSSLGQQNDQLSGGSPLRGLKNITAKGAALSKENDSQSTELECRVCEALRTQEFNLETQLKIFEERSRKENENILAQQAEYQSLKLKRQLEEWKEYHTSLEGELEELRKSSWFDIKLRNEEICALKEEREVSEREHSKQQEASKAARDELEARHAALQIDFESLTADARKSKESVAALEKAAEEHEQVCKEQLEASKQAYSDLELKHASLQCKCGDLQTAAKLCSDEICALKKEREISEREHNKQQESSKVARDELEAKNKSLQTDVESLKTEVSKSKEGVDALEKAAEESDRAYNEQQEASEAMHDELESKLKTLEEKCRDLETSAMQKSEEVKSLKEERRTFKADIDAAIQEHTEKINLLERGYAKKLATANESVKSLEEEAKKRDELHKQEKTILAEENDGLQSEVKCLLLNAQSMEVEIKELNKGIRTKAMANESLNRQLADCLKSKNAMQERVTFLEKEMEQKFNSCTEDGNESPVDLLSASDEEGNRDVILAVKAATRVAAKKTNVASGREDHKTDAHLSPKVSFDKDDDDTDTMPSPKDEHKAPGRIQRTKKAKARKNTMASTVRRKSRRGRPGGGEGGRPVVFWELP